MRKFLEGLHDRLNSDYVNQLVARQATQGINFENNAKLEIRPSDGVFPIPHIS